MITDTFRVRVSLPLKSGARAEADFTLDNNGQLNQQQAMEVQKALKTAAAVAELEMYVSVVSTQVNDAWKPS